MNINSPVINTAKRKMLNGEPAIGVACGFATPSVAEILSGAGFDFLLIDNQHGIFTDETTATAMAYTRLGKAMPMVRVSWNDFGAIGRLLDRGAMGVVVPMVNTVEQAKAAAFATRYPPRGGRSTGGFIPFRYGTNYDDWINDEVFLAVQIETVQAVENAEAILSVDGIDGCWIGPADLAKSMGVDRGTPEGAKAHREMVLRIRDACLKAGKIPGISGDLDVSFWVQNGFKFITASYDGGLMLEGAKQVFNILGIKP